MVIADFILSVRQSMEILAIPLAFLVIVVVAFGIYKTLERWAKQGENGKEKK